MDNLNCVSQIQALSTLGFLWEDGRGQGLTVYTSSPQPQEGMPTLNYPECLGLPGLLWFLLLGFKNVLIYFFFCAYECFACMYVPWSWSISDKGLYVDSRNQTLKSPKC